MGEAGAEDAEALGAAIHVSEQVNADFVRQKRVEPVVGHARVGRDHQRTARDHQACGEILAQFDPGVEGRIGCAIRSDQRVGGAGNLARANHAPFAGDCGKGCQDCLGVFAQGRFDRAILQHRRRPEVGRVARRQHGELLLNLSPLLREQCLEERIFELGKIDLVEQPLGVVGIDFERPVAEARRLIALAGKPIGLHLGRVDRRNRQQEIEAGRNRVELAVGGERGGQESAPAQRAVVRRHILPGQLGEAAGRLEQGVAGPYRHVAEHLRIKISIRREVDVRKPQRDVRDAVACIDHSFNARLEIRP